MSGALRHELQSLAATLDEIRRSLAVCRAITSRLCIEWALENPRSIEAALGDLRRRYEERPTPALARMIELLEAELEERKGWRPFRDRAC
jgi:hypothetical protein